MINSLSIKEQLLNRLKIIGFIFSLVGWFMLITVTLEQIFHKDLSSLERIVETNSFKFGINVFVIALLIILIIGQKSMEKVFEKNKWLKEAIKIIRIVGGVGWIIGLGSLLII